MTAQPPPAIPFADPGAGIETLRGDLVAACAQVIDSGQFILGPEVRAFEREWARWTGAGDAVGVASGTAALVLALRAAGVRPGDEVLVPAMTAVPTWTAVVEAGARPIGVDIEPGRRTIDPEGLAAAISPRTRAIVAVHLCGVPADIDALDATADAAGLTLIEDAAHAHGATLRGRPAGTLAPLAAFSFYPTKNLGAIGDAGAITTADPETAERVRRLRDYGGRNRPLEPGWNARLDELQAAMLRVRLRHLDADVARRREIAGRYLRGLGELTDLGLPTVPADTAPAWHLFVVTHPRRDDLATRLDELGIGTAVHYNPPPPDSPAFSVPRGSFPQTEAHAATALSLPCHPALSDADVDRVIEAIRSAVRESARTQRRLRSAGRDGRGSDAATPVESLRT